ncbi:dienelactone hydrolase family protein [Seohaeicola zhoushanensis]
MSGNWVEIQAADGGTFGAYLARPAKGSGPGLVLLQEIFGVTSDIQAMADMFAEEGYVVAAPDIFWRTEPRLNLRHEGEDMQRAIRLGQGLDDAQAIADIGDVVAALKAMEFCKGGIGVLGHCMGARLAVGAALAGHVDCAAAYYPVGLKRVLKDGDVLPVPTVIHVGTEDLYMGADEVAGLLKRFQDNHEIEIYSYPGAGHAFANRAGTLTSSRPRTWRTAARWRSCARSSGLGTTSTHCGKPIAPASSKPATLTRP